VVGQRRQAAVGDLADARPAVAQPVGDFGGLVAQPVAQPQHLAAALGELVEQGLEVVPQVLALLGGGLRLGQPLEHRRVDRLVELTPAVAPVQAALVAQGAEQPRLGVADVLPLVDQRQQGLLEDVLGVLRRDPVARKEHLETRLDPVEELLQRCLEAGTVQSAHCIHSTLGPVVRRLPGR
jgi:hypothetical protein